MPRGRDGNPERDWGLPSHPVGPGNGTDKKTVRDSQDGKGCAVLAFALVSVPVALAGGGYYLFG